MNALLTTQMRRAATISPCGLYRFALHRWWVEHPVRWILWVMLNPSTANAFLDDRTIERIIAFSREWGYDGLMVGNLYAFRATNPDELQAAADPVGPANDVYVRAMATTAETVVAAWGGHSFVCPAVPARMLQTIGKPVMCLGTTKTGAPRHPLYLPKTTKLTEYKRA